MIPGVAARGKEDRDVVADHSRLLKLLICGRVPCGETGLNCSARFRELELARASASALAQAETTADQTVVPVVKRVRDGNELRTQRVAFRQGGDLRRRVGGQQLLRRDQRRARRAGKIRAVERIRFRGYHL